MGQANPDEPVSLPISPGTTWTDSEGNIWTSAGSLVMQDDSVQSVRQNITSFLRGIHNRWQWYNYPPDVLKTPAVVVNPSDPYIVTEGMDGRTVAWLLELVLVQNRGRTDQALRRIEYMYTEIFESLKDYPSTQVLSLSDIVTSEIGGVEHLTGVMLIKVIARLKKEGN